MQNIHPSGYSLRHRFHGKTKWQHRCMTLLLILGFSSIKIFFLYHEPSSSINFVSNDGYSDSSNSMNQLTGRHLLEIRSASFNQSHDNKHPPSPHATQIYDTTARKPDSDRPFNCTPLALTNFPKDIFTNHQRRRGAVLLHILISIYMFIGLALTCDEYFVPSLEGICNSLHLQADVAGATFMAAGSSAPELATTVIGVFIAQDDIGLGAVVGSADYNIMFVISMCALCARTVIDLNWWPLVRDCAVYSVSIVVLAVIIRDERVYWYEAAIFLVFYALYILLMYYNRPLERYFLNKFPTCVPQRVSKATPVGVCFPHASAPAHAVHHFHEEEDDVHHSSLKDTVDEEDPSEGLYEMNSFSSKKRVHRGDKKNASPYFLLPSEEPSPSQEENNVNHVKGSSTDFMTTTENESNERQSSSAKNHHSFDHNQSNADDNDGDTESEFRPLSDMNSTSCGENLLCQNMSGEIKNELRDREAVSESCFAVLEMPTRMEEEEYMRESLMAGCCTPTQYYVCAILLHTIALPLKLFLCFTVPDCRLRRWKRWFWLTFFTSCLWISIFSYVMIWMISIIGYTFGIPDTIMALTFVAAGSSVPDAIASVIVVREGQGDMAVSNAVGSNVFDILVCMGLPWLLRTLITGKPVSIYSRGLLYAVLTLLSTVVILLVSTHFNRWQLTKRYGILLLIVYGAYLALCTLYELNVFGMVHPPECPL